MSSSLETGPRQGARLNIYALLCISALALALGGCSLFGGGSSTTTGPDTSHPALNQIPWCDQPSIKFQDDSTTQQTVLTDWSQVKDQLNFTPYLPPSLPKGSCLVLAGGTVHDPIYGGRLSITYELPASVPVSFSEAPKRANLGDALQCQASATDATTSICIGAIANTTITIAAKESQGDVQTLFHSLQANVDWVPTVSATPVTTATGTTTTTPAASATATH